jgi:magnesium transporter
MSESVQATTASTGVQNSPLISVYAYNHEELFCSDLHGDFSSITDLLKKYPSVWVRVVGSFDVAAIQPLLTIFNIAKLQLDHLFDHTHETHLTYFSNRLIKLSHVAFYDLEYEKHQSTYFLGERFLLSFHEELDSNIEKVTMNLGHRDFLIRQKGPDFLLYHLLLSSVDSYLRVVRHTGDGISEIEDNLVVYPNSFDMATFIQQRAKLTALKRDIWLQYDILSQLNFIDDLSDTDCLIRKDALSGFQHCVARSGEILNLMDSYIDHYSGLIDIYFSSNSNQINQVMKVLTIFSAVFLPLSFLAGLWGMNFDYSISHWNMPELHWVYGYPMALAIMLMIAIGLIIIFSKAGWIGQWKKRRMERFD